MVPIAAIVPHSLVQCITIHLRSGGARLRKKLLNDRRRKTYVCLFLNSCVVAVIAASPAAFDDSLDEQRVRLTATRHYYKKMLRPLRELRKKYACSGKRCVAETMIMID